MNESIEQLAQKVAYTFEDEWNSQLGVNKEILKSLIVQALTQAREEDKRTIEGLSLFKSGYDEGVEINSELKAKITELESKLLLLSEAATRVKDSLEFIDVIDMRDQASILDEALQSTTPDLTAIRNKIFNEGVEACIVDIGIYIRGRDGRSELMELLAKNKKEVK